MEFRLCLVHYPMSYVNEMITIYYYVVLMIYTHKLGRCKVEHAKANIPPKIDTYERLPIADILLR